MITLLQSCSCSTPASAHQKASLPTINKMQNMVQVLSAMICECVLTSESNAAKSPDVNLWKFFLKLYASTHSEFALLQPLRESSKPTGKGSTEAALLQIAATNKNHLVKCSKRSVAVPVQLWWLLLLKDQWYAWRSSSVLQRSVHKVVCAMDTHLCMQKKSRCCVSEML
jgi:hypothetical protein